MEKETQDKVTGFLEFVNNKYKCFEITDISELFLTEDREQQVLNQARTLRSAIIDADVEQIKICIINLQNLLKKVGIKKVPKFDSSDYDKVKAENALQEIQAGKLKREVFISKLENSKDSVIILEGAKTYRIGISYENFKKLESDIKEEKGEFNLSDEIEHFKKEERKVKAAKADDKILEKYGDLL